MKHGVVGGKLKVGTDSEGSVVGWKEVRMKASQRRKTKCLSFHINLSDFRIK